MNLLTNPEARQLLARRLGSVRLAADPQATDQITGSCACSSPLALCIIAARAELRPDLSLASLAADLAAQPGLDAFADPADPAADLRAVFSWSYRHLDSAAARTFRLAALHPAPDLDPYTIAILSGATPEQAARPLEALARASLIQATGQDRYTMNALVRSYAREQAVHHGEAESRAILTAPFERYRRTTADAVDSLITDETSRCLRVPHPMTSPDNSDTHQARV